MPTWSSLQDCFILFIYFYVYDPCLNWLGLGISYVNKYIWTYALGTWRGWRSFRRLSDPDLPYVKVLWPFFQLKDGFSWGQSVFLSFALQNSFQLCLLHPCCAHLSSWEDWRYLHLPNKWWIAAFRGILRHYFPPGEETSSNVTVLSAAPWILEPGQCPATCQS